MAKILPKLVKAKRPLYAVLFSHEEKSALEEHLPGKWMKMLEIESDVGVWRWVE
jgi:hypothetical protein